MKEIFITGKCNHVVIESNEYINNILLFIFIFYYLTTNYIPSEYRCYRIGCQVKDVCGISDERDCIQWFFKQVSSWDEIDGMIGSFEETFINTEMEPTIKTQLREIVNELKLNNNKPNLYSISIDKWGYIVVSDVKNTNPNFKILNTIPEGEHFSKDIFESVLDIAIHRCNQYVYMMMTIEDNDEPLYHAVVIAGYKKIEDTNLEIYVKNSWGFSPPDPNFYGTKEVTQDTDNNYDVVLVTDEFINKIHKLTFLVPKTDVEEDTCECGIPKCDESCIIFGGKRRRKSRRKSRRTRRRKSRRKSYFFH
jgi:hypothetical protein